MKPKRKSMVDSRAVSPVIGVMLMIVVTVILAAAVSSFAGSVKTKDDPTSAVFDVKCSESDALITIKHMGGDVIYKEDIKIMISHGIPKMTGYLSNENLTFYPAENPDFQRGDGMDKIALQPGQTATYKFHFDTNLDGVEVPVLGAQWVYVGETFEFSIIDVNTENTVFSTNVVMEP